MRQRGSEALALAFALNLKSIRWRSRKNIEVATDCTVTTVLFRHDSITNREDDGCFDKISLATVSREAESSYGASFLFFFAGNPSLFILFSTE